MKNRNQHLLNERQCGLSMYLFGLSILWDLSNNFTNESKFIEDQDETIQSVVNSIPKITTLKCNKSHSDKNDLVDYKKKEISTVVGLLSVFN